MEKKEKAVVDLINKMFEISGHDLTYDDVKDRQDEWYLKNTMTLEQRDEWVEWGINYIHRKFRLSKKLAKKEMDMFDLRNGLKIRSEDQ